MIQALFISVKQSGVFKDGGLGWVIFLGSAGQTVRRVTLRARVAAWRTGTHSCMAVWLFLALALALAFGFGFSFGFGFGWTETGNGTDDVMIVMIMMVPSDGTHEAVNNLPY